MKPQAAPRQMVSLAFLSSLIMLAAGVDFAHAAFPGRNGLLAVQASLGRESRIDLIRADGSVVRRIPCPLRRCEDLWPSWSPDGRSIAFVDRRADTPGGQRLAFVNANGTGRRLLPQLGSRVDVSTPVWSRDGERIAFAASAPNGEVPGGIWSVKRDGSDPRLLIAGGSWPDWASSGRIAFTSATQQIWTTRADGSGGRPLTQSDGTAASWSPRARRIAYQRCGRCQEFPGQTEIWSMTPDGRNQRRLTMGGLPSWSPDGSKIAFQRSLSFQGRAEGVFVMDSNGGHARRLQYTPRIRGRRADIGSTFPDWQPLPRS